MRFTYDALPGRIVFGAGRRSEVRSEIERLGATRVFLISDGQAKAIAEELAGSLDGLVAARWDEVVQHVPVELADRARAAVADAGADVVVTVGGGSSTGLAKAIALTTGLPIVAVPTTYAGSEQTTIYGLTGGRHKQTGRDLVVLPKAVIYDPELTLGLPPGVTGPSACNALAHSVEALWVKEANPVTTALSLEGVRAIAASLPRVMAEPGDLEARSQLMYGAYLSGVALATTSAGLHHKITHVLGGTFNLVHADAHSVVLPHAVAFNAPVLPVEMARLAEALGTPGEDPAGSLWDLATASNVPTSLAALGLRARPTPRGGGAGCGRDHRQPSAVSTKPVCSDCWSARSTVTRPSDDDSERMTNREPRELPRRRRPHADRPDRRRARRCAARRPGRNRGARVVRTIARPRSVRDRRGVPRRRQPGGRGQPQHRPDGGVAGGPADDDPGGDGESPVRLRARGGHRRQSRGRRSATPTS